ncbi:MAG: hypothetical protein KDK39_00970 [Leptospiraceae bacterium]|nr:hypothetical protein [Leptospiraceae bacterium]
MRRVPLRLTKVFAVILLLFTAMPALYAWTMHALITEPALRDLPAVRQAVTVRSLADFVNRHAAALETLLAVEEQWARQNLEFYRPRPDELAFKAATPSAQRVQAFMQAIRVHPGQPSLHQDYLELLPSNPAAGRQRIDPLKLTVFKNLEDLAKPVYVKLPTGSAVRALDVVSTASDEPDMGMDIGLFSDNGTEHGKRYGFGPQPFGNPNLEYGSQAPFHMGFYHEDGITFAAAGFLQHTYPEYRIHLYKTLASFAFANQEDYWGWRFTGWGLHYIGDLSQPYHARALPGISSGRMVCVSLLDIFGFSSFKDNAVQLVSNRHTVVDNLQNQIMFAESQQNYPPDSIALQIVSADQKIIYSDKIPRTYITSLSFGRSDELDALLEDTMPERLVSDPTFELSGSPEGQRLEAEILKSQGPAALKKLKRMLIMMLRSNTTANQAYVAAVLQGSR